MPLASLFPFPWVDGDVARVVYSDLTELEGLEVPVSNVMHEALSAREAVVVPVPTDDAHANEQREGINTLEVYQVFTDAEGSDAVVELYLATDTGARAVELLSHTLPVAIGGPVLLAALTLPLALRLARRYASAESERRALVEEMLATSENERRRLAQLLHDGPVQDLSALSLALELGGPDAASQVREQVSRLRDLLDDLDPVELEDEDMRVALRAVADRIPGHGVDVLVTGDPLAEEAGPTRELVHRCVAELLRNALTHADASRVEIELSRSPDGIDAQIRDDGHGFDPTLRPRGHHGLRLVRAAIEDAGGAMDITTGDDGTTITLRL